MTLAHLIYRSHQFVVSGNQASRVVITDVFEDRSYVMMGKELLSFNTEIRWSKNIERVLQGIVASKKREEAELAEKAKAV